MLSLIMTVKQTDSSSRTDADILSPVSTTRVDGPS